jgi:hypothetical protein
MKKFFHPLLISLVIAIFPSFSQAVDIPQGYLMTISSVWLGDLKGITDTTLKVHVRRFLDPHKKDQPFSRENTFSAEHYTFDHWTNVQSYETEYRNPAEANVFLPMQAIAEGFFYVCFELENIGESCQKISVSKKQNSLYLSTDKQSPSFAVLRYRLTWAQVSRMDTEELQKSDPNNLTLVQLGDIQIDSPKMQKSDFQIQLSDRGKQVGSFGRVLAHPSDYKQPIFGQNQLLLCMKNKAVPTILQSDRKHSWNRFVTGFEFSDSDSLAALTLKGEGAQFVLKFYKVVSPNHWNWLNTGEVQKSQNWLDMSESLVD